MFVIKALNFVCCCVLLPCLACSSSDEDDGSLDGSSSGNSAASGSGANVQISTSGTAGVVGGPNYAGGTRPLTEAEEAQIEDAACAGWTAEAEPLPSRLMMVVDVSSSMSASTPATGGRSKWEVTQDALLETVASLPGSGSLGMLLYPNKETEINSSPAIVDECVATEQLVPFGVLGGPDGEHRQRISTLLADAELHSSTPTHDAYATALTSVFANPAAGIKTFMLLITDGQPTLSQGCVGEQDLRPQPEGPIVDEIANAYANDIPTFVIGSPGSEVNVATGTDARPWLSYAAEQGGTAKTNCSHANEPYCHFDMTTEDDFAAALNEALAQILGQVVQCTYPFPQPPAGEAIDSNAINVVYTPSNGETQLILRASDPACTEGWLLTANNEVELCSETCDRVLSGTVSTLQVHFGCGSIETEIPE